MYLARRANAQHLGARPGARARQRRQREAQVRAPLLERGDPPAGQTRRQRPRDGLDFRQLGHGPTVPPDGSRGGGACRRRPRSPKRRSSPAAPRLARRPHHDRSRRPRAPARSPPRSATRRWRPKHKSRLVGELFARVAERYDLMNDLMSARRPPALEGGADRLAGAAARDAPPGRGRRHRRHRVPGARARGKAQGPAARGDRLRHQPRDARGRPRPGARRQPAARGCASSAPTPRPCRCRLARSMPTPSPSASATSPGSSARWRKPAACCGRAAASSASSSPASSWPPLERPLRRLFLHRGALARRAGRRRSRGLPVSGREHPPLPRPGDLRAA